MRSKPLSTRRDFITGSLMVLAAGTLWSFGSINVRLASDANSWQYLVWRSLGLAICAEIASVMAWRRFLLPRFLAGSPIDLVAALSLSLAAIAFIYALKTTTVANAMFLASITPFVTLVLARAALGEPLTWSAIASVALAGIGLLVMVRGEIGAGNLTGNLAAMLSSLGFAIYSICVRKAPGRDWLPALSGYAWMTSILCAVVVLVQGRTLVPAAPGIGLAVLHGAVFIGLGLYLFNLASPHMPAAGLTVLAQTETILAPVWVFLLLGERPLATTMLGGAIILASILLMALAGSRKVTPGPGPPAE